MLPLEKNILPMVESVYSNLTQTEKDIANYFINDWRKTDDISAQSLSKKLFVSIPSLTRFAKKCGYTGYRQFVFELEGTKNDDQNINSDLTKNVLNDYERLLKKTYSLIDEK
ncbi:MurR/RpiR family transcriptional regulator [Streptococcus pasteurianus]|uniref:MurR/RpiR family transcriptional regulator n=1 Tax=Streptococcus pasteurianus TaxID=197614 RepID=UPI0020BFB74C|nr:hypothetical protein [Streptococcus pasteurianus]WCQ69484.1 hypothetical protein M0P24_07205 [Streptococcus pasteurianus]